MARGDLIHIIVLLLYCYSVCTSI